MRPAPARRAAVCARDARASPQCAETNEGITMTNMTRTYLMVAALGLASSFAAGGLQNGDFENGLAGWQIELVNAGDPTLGSAAVNAGVLEVHAQTTFQLDTSGGSPAWVPVDSVPLLGATVLVGQGLDAGDSWDGGITESQTLTVPAGMDTLEYDIALDFIRSAAITGAPGASVNVSVWGVDSNGDDLYLGGGGGDPDHRYTDDFGPSLTRRTLSLDRLDLSKPVTFGVDVAAWPDFLLDNETDLPFQYTVEIDMSLDNVAFTPEPGTLALLGVGAGLLLRRRTR